MNELYECVDAFAEEMKLNDEYFGMNTCFVCALWVNSDGWKERE